MVSSYPYPVSSQYPFLTPYQFASNRPIDGIDLDGLEFSKKGYFTRTDVTKRLLILKNDPDQINQGGTGTCVLAAVTYLWIKNDWNSFASAALNLYYTGKAKVNDYEITSNNISQNLNPNTAGSSQEKYQAFDGEQAVDWMVLNSIQNSQHGPHYGLASEQAGNSDKDIKTFMITLLGFQDVKQDVYNSTDYKPTASILTDMQQRFENGFQEIINLNPNLFAPNTSSHPNSAGGHAVVYAGNLKTRLNINNDIEYSFDIVTWGSTTTTPFFSGKDFQKYFKSTTYGKPKEEKK